MELVVNLARGAGEVDILVNNAGTFPVAPTVEQNLAGFESMFDTIVRGTCFLVTWLAN